MSREIKFRAWHKTKEKYYPTVSLNFYTQEVCIGKPYVNVWVSFDEVALEQYTGLKDKNGKEIYVNDILKVTLENTREIFICLSDYKEFVTNSIYSAYHELEVIGNIHENKELLK